MRVSPSYQSAPVRSTPAERRLRAAADEHARLAETLRAAAADADLARERAEHDSHQAQARAETTEGRAETARQEAADARLALVVAQGEAAGAARLQGSQTGGLAYSTVVSSAGWPG
ncbi:hypothetical protein ACWCSD_50145 [Nonomuraea sp. NPDC001684]